MFALECELSRGGERCHDCLSAIFKGEKDVLANTPGRFTGIDFTSFPWALHHVWSVAGNVEHIWIY